MSQMIAQDPATTRRLTVLGVHLYSAAYPNTKFVIDHLREDEDLRPTEINYPLFHENPFARRKLGVAGKLGKVFSTFTRAIYSHVAIFLRYWLHAKADIAYVPYPAIGILVLFSFLPQRWRPGRLIADAFISIYDTAVIDRGLIASDTLMARTLLAAERRAYRAATRVIVDTDENRAYYAQLFGLPVDKFAVVPLATDENVFRSSPYTGSANTCHVVFVGTFVPLQGTDVIARTITILRDREDIHFTIIGTGQTAESFAAIIGDDPPANLTWIQDWQDSMAVARHIESADICLGIFSPSPKAQRVWPYKNYAYMTIGRPIVTADTMCARRMLEPAANAPFATVRPGDPQALAEKLMQLADDPSDRIRLARNARFYYDEQLANKVVISILKNKILFAGGPQRTSDL